MSGFLAITFFNNYTFNFHEYFSGNTRRYRELIPELRLLCLNTPIIFYFLINVLPSILVPSGQIKLYIPAARISTSSWLWVVFITVRNTLTFPPAISTTLT